MREIAKVFRHSACVLTAVAFLAWPGARADELASGWVEGFNSRLRLIAGSVSGPEGAADKVYAGIAIAMSPGFKTYWRNPGEAGGVPPEFDFSQSQNLASATVLYPAPHRTKDKAGENIAYKDEVVFPVEVVPKDAAAAVVLKLKAAYGVCKDICIPAESEADITIPAKAPRSRELDAALAKVPAADAAGAAGRSGAKGPRVDAWRVDGAKGKLTLDVATAGGEGTDVFLFAPDGLYMPMTKAAGGSGGAAIFEADLGEGGDLKGLAGKTISATVVNSAGQTETFIQLPEALGSR